jgi:hypothetical protein
VLGAFSFVRFESCDDQIGEESRQRVFDTAAIVPELQIFRQLVGPFQLLTELSRHQLRQENYPFSRQSYLLEESYSGRAPPSERSKTILLRFNDPCALTLSLEENEVVES